MGKAWAWFKSLGWVAIAGTIVTAILMVLSGAKATRLERRAKDAERAAETLAHEKTRANIKRAEKFQKAAEKDKAKAAEAKQKTEARIEELGNKDETLDDIADRFNSRRLRKSTG